ncbi:glucan biosynthesis protein [Thalassobaculum sp.]|uniref:glucan biosynthesis protein n=1 Tax=Thalassobaculum sp. TaxID=2022740 RepID=UPI003B5AADF8
MNSRSNDRRWFLRTTAAASVMALTPLPSLALAGMHGPDFGKSTPFDAETLVRRAAEMAKQPFTQRQSPAPEITPAIDYQTHGAVRYDRDKALFGKAGGSFPVTFFPLGTYFPRPVSIHAVSGGASAPVLYAPELFDIPEGNLIGQLPRDAGFAGFRIHEDRDRDDWRTQDWAAFLGASYFRAIGALGQYGISARGITINTATAGPEEFPDFTEFHFEPDAGGPNGMRVHALLDGPSVTGAYSFDLHRDTGVLMEISARIFLRQDVERLGIAPLTSMYWYSERKTDDAPDWRPEVHDSDGLAIWSGSGERIWRPLNNPETVVTSSFQEATLKGFGLLQRDREFEHYLDGVNYHLRPSLWVEPLGDWGAGSVQLVEIPTDDEIHDNIVAQWTPAAPASKGSDYAFRYRLHWVDEEPYPTRNVAQAVATRAGRGGEPGQPRPEGATRYVVDFDGGPLRPDLTEDEITAKVEAKAGKILRARGEPVPHTERWRMVLDVLPDGPDPVEIRGYLERDGEPLTETWLHQHRPGSELRGG